MKWSFRLFIYQLTHSSKYRTLYFYKQENCKCQISSPWLLIYYPSTKISKFKELEEYIQFLVPTSPPRNITIRTSSPNWLTTSWNEVHIRGLEITAYILFYREKAKVSSMYDKLSTNQTSLVLSGLKAGTRYVLRLLASTKSGNGIATKPMVVETKEDGRDTSSMFVIIDC